LKRGETFEPNKRGGKLIFKKTVGTKNMLGTYWERIGNIMDNI
jgi:hypothetical protein